MRSLGELLKLPKGEYELLNHTAKTEIKDEQIETVKGFPREYRRLS